MIKIKILPVCLYQKNNPLSHHKPIINAQRGKVIAEVYTQRGKVIAEVYTPARVPFSYYLYFSSSKFQLKYLHCATYIKI